MTDRANKRGGIIYVIKKKKREETVKKTTTRFKKIIPSYKSHTHYFDLI